MVYFFVVKIKSGEFIPTYSKFLHFYLLYLFIKNMGVTYLSRYIQYINKLIGMHANTQVIFIAI